MSYTLQPFRPPYKELVPHHITLVVLDPDGTIRVREISDPDDQAIYFLIRLLVPERGKPGISVYFSSESWIITDGERWQEVEFKVPTTQSIDETIMHIRDLGPRCPTWSPDPDLIKEIIKEYVGRHK